MNKKYLMFGVLGLFAMVLVTAGLIQYYGQVETTIEVTQPIQINGDVEHSSITGNVPCDAGETCPGEVITIENTGDNERTILITNNAVEGEVEVSYVGVLELTKKDTTTWFPVEPVETIEINYTVVGDNFEFSGVPGGYTLIYYKDEVVGLTGRLANPQPAIIVTSAIGSLPQSNDANANLSADYCNNESDNYESCRGAKLWVVLTSDIVGNNLNWANMANYYYETNLIQYNTDGEIIVYGGEELSLTPKYTLDSGLNEDDQIINTTINVA